MNASVLRQTSGAADGLTPAGAGPRYVAVRDLMLVGPRSGSVVGVRHTTTTGAVASCDLSRLFVKDLGGHGVGTDVLITSILTDVRVQGRGGDGVRLRSGTSVASTACYALSCRGPGYVLDDVTYSTLVNCARDNCPVGYHLPGSRNISLVACGCERAGRTGHLIESGSSNSLLNRCSSGAGDAAFHATGGSALVTLLGVRETAPADTATAPIRVDEGCSAFVIGPSVLTATRCAPNTTGRSTPADLVLASPSTATAGLERAGTTDAASYTLATAGAPRRTLGLDPDSTEDLHLRNEARSQTAILAEDRSEQPNLQLLGGTRSFGGGDRGHRHRGLPPRPHRGPDRGRGPPRREGRAEAPRQGHGHKGPPAPDRGAEPARRGGTGPGHSRSATGTHGGAPGFGHGRSPAARSVAPGPAAVSSSPAVPLRTPPAPCRTRHHDPLAHGERIWPTH